MVTEGQYLQSQFTAIIERIGIQTTIYRPTSVLRGDGNIVPDAVERVGASKASIQTGPSAQAQANALGVFGVQSALVAYPAAAEQHLALGNVITDAKRRCWLIRSEPTLPELASDAVVSIWFIIRIADNALPTGITL